MERRRHQLKTPSYEMNSAFQELSNRNERTPRSLARRQLETRQIGSIKLKGKSNRHIVNGFDVADQSLIKVE
jgi:hypothetical protein